MTATERLRAMLDERWVEWETDRSGFRVMWGRPVDEFHDTMEFKAVDNALPNGGLNVHICGATPEQAIAATLGAGTCHPIISDNLTESEGTGDAWADCSECGHLLYVLTDPNSEPPNYCPNCGRKVVDE